MKREDELIHEHLREKIKSYATELGFDMVRILSAERLSDAGAFFEKWLREGHGADMEYLSADPSRRYTPEEILRGAKSVIMLGLNYYKTEHQFRDSFRIAKYAQGRDYHKVITTKLKKFSKFLAELEPKVEALDPDPISTKSAVDFGPLMERAFAAKSSMGFLGKNACIITREYGSWVFLSEVITTLELTPDEPTKWAGACGTCTRCISHCPTGAIGSDRTINARLCISYLTIENRGSIPVELRPKIGNWLFGCDICQDVCPHNTRAQPTRVEDFQNIPVGIQSLSLAQILSIETDEEFLRLFAGTPLMRAKRRGLIRNACVVAGNLLRDTIPATQNPDQIRTTLLPLLERLASSSDAMIAEHARWAIG